MRKNLTDDLIAEMTAKKGERIEVADAKCAGLHLRVGSRGDKTFSVVCRTKGAGPATTTTGKRRASPPQRFPLGSWPDLSIDDARSKAIRIIGAAQRGVAPGQDANGAKGPLTLTSVLDRYISAKKRDGIRTWPKVESEIRRHALPRFGPVRLDAITRTDVHEFLDDMVDDDLMGAAREIRKHLVNLMNWAEDRGYIAVNVLRGLKRKDLANNADAGRALADHELIAIWQALSKTNYPYADFVKVLMLTGQRRSDWSDASRPEIDQQSRSLEIPAKRYKGQRDHVVPISAAVHSIVGALPLWNEGTYLFSTTGGAKPFSGFSKAKQKLDCDVRASIPELMNWRLHDLRVTCKTRMAKLGVASDIRDAVLGHAKRGLDRIYDKHERFDEKRAALDLYADHILSIVEGDR